LKLVSLFLLITWKLNLVLMFIFFHVGKLGLSCNCVQLKKLLFAGIWIQLPLAVSFTAVLFYLSLKGLCSM